MRAGGIQGTSREGIYAELGLYTLLKRRWHNKLVFLYKIINRLLPDNLYSYLDFSSLESYLLTSSSSSIMKRVPARTKPFRRKFFAYYINEWNKLKVEIRNTKSINILKNLLYAKAKENLLFCIYDPLGIKVLTRLRL